LSLSSLNFGEDQSQSKSQVSPELRKDMANMHQKMADCLRTDKSLSLEECQRKVAKDCPIVAKTGQRPIEKGMGPMTGPHEMR
jgi:hypothetical protein